MLPEKAQNEEQTFVTENSTIIQSNFFIEHQKKLSLAATQLFYTIAGMINKDDEDFKDYYIDYEMFAKLWNIDKNNIYYYLQLAGAELTKNGISYFETARNGKRKYISVSLLSYYEYEEGQKYAIARFDKSLKPHFIELKQQFTKSTLKYYCLLSNNGAKTYTIRTYLLLKQYQTIGTRMFNVFDYKDTIGLVERDTKTGKVTNEKYLGRNNNLKSKILDPAMRYISEYTDIIVEYKIVGRGANAKIEFDIQTKKVEQPKIENTITETISDEDVKPDAYKEHKNDIPPVDTEEYDEFLDNNFTEEEQLIMSVVPEDVHSYDKDKLKAIYSLSANFTFSFDDINRQMSIINNIGRFTLAIWKPTKARNCKTNNKYGYYYSCFQAWLENQKLQKQQHFD